MKAHLRGWLTGALAGLVIILPTLSGCGALGPTTASGPVWGLPYKPGTTVTLGSFGLHDDNFGSMPGNGFTYHFGGADATVNDASLDLLPQGTSVPVIPLASGTVLATWPMCHLVVVDHGNGVWVEYLHIDVDGSVTPGKPVTRDTTLGTTTTSVSTGEPCREKSEGGNGPVEHVHFAFLQAAPSNGSTVPPNPAGTFQSMVNRVMCGFQVIKNAQYPIGALQEVAHPNHIIAPNDTFMVPDCASSTSPVASPTPSSTSSPTPNIAGDWQLSGVDPSTYSCNLTLQQNGTAITGGASCYNLNGITISGSLSGNHISMQGDDEFQPGDTIRYQFTGTVNNAANEMQGTYVANDPAGEVAPQGTWSATRSS